MTGINLIEVTDSDFEEKVLKSEVPVIVDFWAPWCGPCKQFAPAFENLSLEYAGQVIFAKVNVDENQKYAGEFGIMSIPTIIVFKDGNIFQNPIIGANLDGIRSLLDNLK
ncbi:thioredoxin [Candidatus Vampirococcus lugosii]|uniref:Thioredoxin n=1 Tax=Candidatus Vampirococcus lugosii TaxID=2789015 RepID=A0ABS5QMK1_9BACT|nr:thioredoxin [Candidatus Vampirococcus lugosii]